MNLVHLNIESIQLGHPLPFVLRGADGVLLAQKGSLYVTRPILDHYMRTRQEGEALVRALFDIVLSGKVKIAVDQTYPLAEAAQAHRDLESRKTTGSTILVP